MPGPCRFSGRPSTRFQLVSGERSQTTEGWIWPDHLTYGLCAMARVELTRHLFQFFPALDGCDLDVPGATVAEIVEGLDKVAPGIAYYLCDERGRLRRHVNVFVDEQSVIDRGRLADPVKPDSAVFIAQALSGG